MKIIKYEDKYRDDMIFMILEAKNVLGRVPGLNEDLLDIKKNYLDVGDMFWLAIDEHDRVIGSIGYNSIKDTNEVWLHRLYVKYNLKRKYVVKNCRRLYCKARKGSHQNSFGWRRF